MALMTGISLDFHQAFPLTGDLCGKFDQHMGYIAAISIQKRPDPSRIHTVLAYFSSRAVTLLPPQTENAFLHLTSLRKDHTLGPAKSADCGLGLCSHASRSQVSLIRFFLGPPWTKICSKKKITVSLPILTTSTDAPQHGQKRGSPEF